MDNVAKKKVTLNVTLLKKGLNINEPNSFIEDYSKSEEIDFEENSLNVILYKKLGKKKEDPAWLEILKEKVIPSEISEFFPPNQASGAALFIENGDRIFAITFGTMGRHILKKESIDKRFGIYTANRMLNENESIRIKSTQSRINETNPVNKQRQYGEAISDKQLLLTLEDNEALKELAILNEGSEDLPRFTGKVNSLNLQFRFPKTEIPCLHYLPSRLEELLEIYYSVTKEDVKTLYKGLYPLEDSEATALENDLTEEITSSQGSFSLFEPEIDFDLSQVSEFKIVAGTEKHESDELALENYLLIRERPTLDHLKQDIVYVIDDEGAIIKKWQLYECLYGEIKRNGNIYILSQGEWFEVSNDRYSRITSKIDAILDPDFRVPDQVKEATQAAIAKAADERQNPTDKISKENLFNRELCGHLDGELFDEPSKQITVYEDKIEVSDILVPAENRYIHVKCNHKASDLSHLFNQGFVSATSYAKFKDVYVSKVNEHISDPNKRIPENPLGAIIHYLIINEKKKDRLTFFSKVTLEEKVRTLEAMGFIVKLSWVRGVYNKKTGKTAPPFTTTKVIEPVHREIKEPNDKKPYPDKTFEQTSEAGI